MKLSCAEKTRDMSTWNYHTSQWRT